MGGRVIVEGDGAGGVVEVDGGDDEVGEGDFRGGGFGDEGEEGDEFCGVLVVGLVVEDYARFVGWCCCAGWDGGRHGGELMGSNCPMRLCVAEVQRLRYTFLLSASMDDIRYTLLATRLCLQSTARLSIPCMRFYTLLQVKCDPALPQDLC